MQGYHELKRLDWDEKGRVLSGECERMAGINGRLFVYVPKSFAPHFEFPLNTNSAALTHIQDTLWAFEVNFRDTRHQWKIPFDRTP